MKRDRSEGPPKPRMWDAPEETGKERSQKQERRLSKELGFRLQPGSGMFPQVWAKEDGVDRVRLYQLKSTVGKDARIVTVEALATLAKRAATLGKDPVMLVTFVGAKAPMEEDWVLVPMSVWRKGHESRG